VTNSTSIPAKLLDILTGMTIFWVFLLAGTFLKTSLNLILPGNAYKPVWIEWGRLLVPTLVISVIAVWISVGHLYQKIEPIK